MNNQHGNTQEEKPILLLFHPDACRCKSCKRRLPDPESVAREVGPECWKKGGGERYQFMFGFDSGEASRA